MSTKLDVFEREFGMIQAQDVKDFVGYVLDKVPPYFWLVPSSSTGKHHPPQDQGQGGLVRHSKAVVYFANRFCQSYDITGRERDIVLSAALLHDIIKYGLTLGRWTTKTHGKDGADFILNVWKMYITEKGEEAFPKEDAMEIGKAVAFHMGRWTEGGKKFPEEFTVNEQIVHLADMMSAGREVMLEFLQESLIG